MRNLNNVELNAVSGGAEIRYCDIEKIGNPIEVVARLSFVNSTNSTLVEKLYNAVKKELLGDNVAKDLNDEYKMACYIFNQ